MDDIFQQHRLTLADLNASLQKAEIGLERCWPPRSPMSRKFSPKSTAGRRRAPNWKSRMPACRWGFAAC
jgi:hypothetical protein